MYALFEKAEGSDIVYKLLLYKVGVSEIKQLFIDYPEYITKHDRLLLVEVKDYFLSMSMILDTSDVINNHTEVEIRVLE